MPVISLIDSDVLLVVDVQNDFCHGGSLAVQNGDEVIPVVNRLAKVFPHTILTQDWHTKGHLSFASSHSGKKPFETVKLSYGDQVLWPDHCVQDSHGAMLHEKLDIPNAELIIRKGYNRDIDSYSAFFENDHKTPTGLAGYLRDRGLKRLFITGLATDFCVMYSAIDGKRLGFDVFVVEDGCRGIDMDGSLEKAWESMAKADVKRIHERDLSIG